MSQAQLEAKTVATTEQAFRKCLMEGGGKDTKGAESCCLVPGGVLGSPPHVEGVAGSLYAGSIGQDFFFSSGNWNPCPCSIRRKYASNKTSLSYKP